MKRPLDAEVRRLFEPLFEATVETAGWEITNWDCEQGLCLVVQAKQTFLLLELEPRVEGRPTFATTERFGVQARKTVDDGRPLSPGQVKLVEGIVEVIRRREHLLPELERPTTGSKKLALRHIEVDRVLMPEGHGQYYVNPYAGCVIGCDFCYVAERADFSRSLEGLPALPWGRYVDVKDNAAAVLAEEVKHHPPGIVRFSPILTDPYQGPEGRFHITRACLEVLLPAGFTPVILTRGARVMDDLELLSKFPKAAVGLSIPTTDDAIRRIFEPGADPVEDRFEALAAAHAAGLDTFVVIQPMLPMDTSEMVERLTPLVKSVRVDRMHFRERVEHLYREHELMYALEDRWFEETERALVEPLRAAGIGVDDMDDMAALIGG